MISKSRKKIILTVAIFSIAMILANILHADTVSFVPLEIKDLSLDNIDEGTYQTPDTDEKVETVRTSFTSQGPIHIDEYEVEGITWEQAKDEFELSGFGTVESPYRIAWFNISGGDSANCITIENSNAHFLIYACEVHNSKKGDPYEDAGIKLINTNNGKIISNKIYLNENGISLTECENIIILENSVYDNDGTGIAIVSSDHNTISRNIANDNDLTGIAIGYSNYNTISRNTVNDNEYFGINLYESHDNTISKNNIINNGAFDGTGLRLYYSDNNTISENYLLKNGQYPQPYLWCGFGIYLEDSDENILIKNRILESRVGFFIDELSNDNNITENV
ncbi:MAG: nitrous oxide reductase family maturation protein NosD, partial [Candidatus Hodarchaeota archaeon]